MSGARTQTAAAGPERRRELWALAATVMVASLGLSLASGTIWRAVMTAALIAAQGARGIDRPIWSRSRALPLCLVFAVASALLGLIGDPILRMAEFLLAVQWVYLTTERSRRHESQLLLINVIHVGVVALEPLGFLFGIYLAMFLASSVTALALRRWARVKERYVPPKPGAAAPRAGPLLRSLGLVVAALILFAGLTFSILPRSSGGSWSLPGTGSKMVGFSDRVSLDAVGRIKQNTAVVMRVTVERGEVPARPYFRGKIFDLYRDRRWIAASRSWFAQLQRRDYRFRLPERRTITEPEHSLTFSLEAFETQVLFSGGPTSHLFLHDDSIRSLFYDLQSGLQAPKGVYPLTYQAESNWFAPHPPLRGRAGALQSKQALTIPKDLDGERLRAYAERILDEASADRTSRFREARAIEDFLRERYSYTLDAVDPGSSEPIEAFLYEHRRGHCELFASALVFLLRSIGIPARLVNGFAGGEYSSFMHSFLVRQSHAHAWVEALIPRRGWMTFDATPPPPPGEESAQLGWARDWLDMKWSRYVEGFSAYDQRSTWQALQESLGAWTESKSRGASAPAGDLVFVLILAALFLVAFSLWRLLRKRRSVERSRASLSGPPRSRRELRALLAALRLRGLARDSGETLREFFQRVVEAGIEPRLPELAAAAMDYNALSFGRPHDATRRDRALAARLRGLRRRLEGRGDGARVAL